MMYPEEHATETRRAAVEDDLRVARLMLEGAGSGLARLASENDQYGVTKIEDRTERLLREIDNMAADLRRHAAALTRKARAERKETERDDHRRQQWWPDPDAT